MENILHEKGIFAEWGEEIFDDYWMNYGRITITDSRGNLKPIRNLEEYLQYRGLSHAKNSTKDKSSPSKDSRY
nr:type II restriction endonuclease [Helicobacter suis]